MARLGVVWAVSLLLILGSFSEVEPLSSNYYANSCPSAESTIAKVVKKAIKGNKRVGAGLIRLLFHDCFVEGCDASILIQAPNAEITALPNLSLHSLNVIDNAKAAVEAICPNTVSCADIIAYAAATSVTALGGISQDPLGGRYDGLVSSASEAAANIPSPFSSLGTLQGEFASRGLSTSDLVILSGSHTVGKAHCATFAGRLHNFSSTASIDPSLSPQLAKTLLKDCPLPLPPNELVSMDATPTFFDNNYYQEVQNEKGLFVSDSQLYSTGATRQLVDELAGSDSDFLTNYAAALVKLGQIGLKTSSNGNIRTKCYAFN